MYSIITIRLKNYYGERTIEKSKVFSSAIFDFEGNFFFNFFPY
jgi:hypothetical protein